MNFTAENVNGGASHSRFQRAKKAAGAEWNAGWCPLGKAIFPVAAFIEELLHDQQGSIRSNGHCQGKGRCGWIFQKVRHRVGRIITGVGGGCKR